MKKLILALLIFSSIFIIAAKKPKSTGISGYEIIQVVTQLIGGGTQWVDISCPEGKAVLSGGADIEIIAGYPILEGAAWRMHIQNGGPNLYEATSFAICADAVQ